MASVTAGDVALDMHDALALAGLPADTVRTAEPEADRRG